MRAELYPVGCRNPAELSCSLAVIVAQESADGLTPLDLGVPFRFGKMDLD